MRPMIRLCTALALACAATVLTPATAFSSSAVPAVGLPVTGLALPKVPVPKVALPPPPKVALPPAPKVALPPPPKVALPPAPKVALPPPPKVALPPAPKVALPALRPPAPAPKLPVPVLPKPVLNPPGPEPAPARLAESGQANARMADTSPTTKVASSGTAADRAASGREPQNSAAQLPSDPVGEYLLGLVHDELCVALASIITPLPARIEGLPSSVIRQLPPSITNVVPQRVLSRASVRCSAAATDGGSDGLTRVLGFLAHSGWAVGALLPLGLALLGAGLALCRTARVRAITGPCRQRVRRIHLWGSPASSNTAPWAAYPIRS